MEKNVLQQNPVLKQIFTTAEFLYEKPLTISKVSFNKKQQVEDHILMIGDAAGMITPLCGNGMSMAMHAGKLAFDAINDYLQKKINRLEMEEQYTSRWNKQFSTRLFVGRNVQRLVGGNASTAMFLQAMKHFPLLAKTVIQSTHGKPF